MFKSEPILAGNAKKTYNALHRCHHFHHSSHRRYTGVLHRCKGDCNCIGTFHQCTRCHLKITKFFWWQCVECCELEIFRTSVHVKLKPAKPLTYITQNIILKIEWVASRNSYPFINFSNNVESHPIMNLRRIRKWLNYTTEN